MLIVYVMKGTNSEEYSGFQTKQTSTIVVAQALYWLNLQQIATFSFERS